MIKCPYCGNLVSDDELEDRYADGDGNIVDKVWGVCKNCEKAFYWKRIYSYKGTDEIKEDTKY